MASDAEKTGGDIPFNINPYSAEFGSAPAGGSLGFLPRRDVGGHINTPNDSVGEMTEHQYEAWKKKLRAEHAHEDSLGLQHRLNSQLDPVMILESLIHPHRGKK